MSVYKVNIFIAYRLFTIIRSSFKTNYPTQIDFRHWNHHEQMVWKFEMKKRHFCIISSSFHFFISNFPRVFSVVFVFPSKPWLIAENSFYYLNFFPLLSFLMLFIKSEFNIYSKGDSVVMSYWNEKKMEILDVISAAFS